ncbi:MAG: hypothetical protein QXX45_03325 [Candidatus Aenigmatarchaeota archaeon]
MAQTIRVSLPGYNALTDTNLDHYALYADSDNILIKEYIRGSVSVNSSDYTSISHNLGYLPFTIVFFEITSGVWRKLIGSDEWSGYDTYYSISTSDIKIYNYTGSTKNYKYYIFYDKIL